MQNSKITRWCLHSFLILFILTSFAHAHVPYFELRDFSNKHPFKVPKTIDQSIAVYSWLQRDVNNNSDDLDVYTFSINAPKRIFLEVLVPACPSYEFFLPWFALVGPGLPEPEEETPFDIPVGYGALITKNFAPGNERPEFYEPFGDKTYYTAPGFDQQVYLPGKYFIYYWDPYYLGGDYVAVIGWKEIWEADDILRGLIFTPLIRNDKELHVDCPD